VGRRPRQARPGVRRAGARAARDDVRAATPERVPRGAAGRRRRDPGRLQDQPTDRRGPAGRGDPGIRGASADHGRWKPVPDPPARPARPEHGAAARRSAPHHVLRHRRHAHEAQPAGPCHEPARERQRTGRRLDHEEQAHDRARQGPLRHRRGQGHRMGDLRPLRRHVHASAERHRHGDRSRDGQDGHRAGRRDVPRVASREVVTSRRRPLVRRAVPGRSGVSAWAIPHPRADRSPDLYAPAGGAPKL
jgi:hypothetical protein